DIRSRRDRVGEERTNHRLFSCESCSMVANQDSPVFSYQTRGAVSAEQEQLLRECAGLFGHVERTLFVDIRKTKDAGQLKSEYLAPSVSRRASSTPCASNCSAKSALSGNGFPYKSRTRRRKSAKPRKSSASWSNTCPYSCPWKFQS